MELVQRSRNCFMEAARSGLFDLPLSYIQMCSVTQVELLKNGILPNPLGQGWLRRIHGCVSLEEGTGLLWGQEWLSGEGTFGF